MKTITKILIGIGILVLIIGMSIFMVYQNYSVNEIKIVECECGGESNIKCNIGECVITEDSYNGCGTCKLYGTGGSGQGPS